MCPIYPPCINPVWSAPITSGKICAVHPDHFLCITLKQRDGSPVADIRFTVTFCVYMLIVDIY